MKATPAPQTRPAAIRALALSLFFLVPASPASAQVDTRQADTRQAEAGLADAADMAAIYRSFCLDNFPNDAGLGTLAASRSAVPMIPAQLQQYLHVDTGHGWYLSTPFGRYAITIADPPYRGCAVRRMTPSGLLTAAGYITAVKAYAQQHGGQLSPAQTIRRKAPDGVADISVSVNTLLGADAKAGQETFLLVLTNYHGRPPDEDRAAAGDGVGVEVRLAHLVTT